MSEAPHSGAIPCIDINSISATLNNLSFLSYDFSIEFQFSCLISEDKNRENAQEVPLTDTSYVGFLHWVLFFKLIDQCDC